ncbi:GNAT family N-acetyltransferase [Streptomyces sp. JJ36]|uniref:GNAT family N-acetyltransferase n=1 Tax=Streptomyces sp. JJ36 TaxID=2736645 RepID=UPI001F428741|nr:GNAT family N-acetyltransferase [Streptomyces sp. JJ36]MCF6522243.1 GNAT family N-acetyltransferase [Streptomyces sp. JJ36]
MGEAGTGAAEPQDAGGDGAAVGTRAAPEHTVHRLTAGEFRGCVPALGALLAAVVADGASLGFLTPFAPAEAARWWRDQEPAVACGRLAVWVARERPGGPLAGTVGLVREPKPNGRHRAEIVKLMVHRDARGHGLGRRLLATAEQAAAEAGATLLLLDTETGSAAEHLYAAAGWTRYGVVAEYAADPSGVLRDCTFFSKRLG